MSSRHITDSARLCKAKRPEISNEPNPATVDDIVEMLTQWETKYTRLIVETFRELWDRGELKTLAKLYKAVHRKFLLAVEAGLPKPYDPEDQQRNKKVLDTARKRIYDVMDRATEGNGKALRPYFEDSLPLSDEQRKRFGELWSATEDQLRRRAKLINPDAPDELLSDTVARLVKQEVFQTLAPEYDPERFLHLAFKCMRMAHRKNRENKGRQRYQLGRYKIRKGTGQAVGKSQSRVVEYVCRMESLSILLDCIAQVRSERRRDALISYYLEDESTEEMAKRWDTTMSNVNSYCSHGINNLRDLVPSSLDPGGFTSDQVTSRMACLRGRGESWASIGEKFGVTRKSVEKRVKRWQKLQPIGRAG